MQSINRTARWECGTKVMLNGAYGVIKVFDKDVAAIFFDDGMLVQYEPKVLINYYAAKKLSFIGSTPKINGDLQLTQGQKENAKYRLPFCQALLKLGRPGSILERQKIINEVVDGLDEKDQQNKRPSPESLRRWYNQYIEDDLDITPQVIPQRDRPNRIDDEVEQQLLKAVKKGLGKSNEARLYRDFKKVFDKLGYQEDCPSRSTYYRRVAAQRKLAAIFDRDGKSAAREAARTSTIGYQLTYPLERVELDAAHFNIGLMNDEGYYVGSLTVFFAICCTTRVILGYSMIVGKGGEDSGSVVQSLLHSIEPKNDPDYPYAGIADLYVADGGGAYRSKSTKKFINSIQSDLVICETRMGWGKGFIESFIRTFRRKFWDGVDGYLDKYDPKKYQESTLIKSTRWTVKEMSKMIAEFIRDVYHHEAHSGIDGMTPHDKWESLIYDYPPQLPVDTKNLALFRGLKIENRVLNPTRGVFYKNQWFQSNELAAMYHDLVPNTDKVPKICVDIMVNPLDARGVSVIDERNKGQLMDVPHSQRFTEQLSFNELNARRYDRKVENEFSAKIKGDIKIKPQTTPRRKGPVTDVESGDFDVGGLFEKEDIDHNSQYSVEDTTNSDEYHDDSNDNPDDYEVEV
jgi:hypothetical protein